MIVSDSTALIILFDLERVELLENLFEVVYISPIILEEISVKYPVVLPNFIKIEKLKESTLFNSLKMLLDLGESEAIALAKEKASLAEAQSSELVLRYNREMDMRRSHARNTLRNKERIGTMLSGSHIALSMSRLQLLLQAKQTKDKLG